MYRGLLSGCVKSESTGIYFQELSPFGFHSLNRGGRLCVITASSGIGNTFKCKSLKSDTVKAFLLDLQLLSFKAYLVGLVAHLQSNCFLGGY